VAPLAGTIEKIPFSFRGRRLLTVPGKTPGSGERIGAYEIQGLLGRGGMGEVFLAWDARLRRRVAIKRIRLDHGINPAMRQRLLREARAVAGLSHPAVVQIYDLIEDAAGDCIVLEHVEGRTLAATLAEAGRLEPVAAVRLACEIAGGLAAAHAAGIVHRDLKAENVIVTPAGRAKILDFGLAQVSVRATDDHLVTQHGVLLGTFHMMSPEQASGEETDERSDLFSLGILLYEMLTGRSPFRGSHPTETIRRVLSENPPRVDVVRPGLPARLGDLVARLLAKEPAARPGSAAEVVRELEAIAASLVSSDSPTLVASVSDLPTAVEVSRPAISQPVAPHPAAPGSTVGMSVLRRRHVREIAAAVLLAAVVGAGFLFLRWRSGPKPKAPATAVAPLRVVVPQPEVDGQDERLALAASGALSASLNTLASLQGVVPLDKLQLVGAPKSAVDMARVAAANEVLAVRLEAAGPVGRITLRRIHGAEGRVMWTDAFDAPIEAADLRLLAEAVSIHLRRGYPGQPPRPGTSMPEVRNEDYTTFLQVKQNIDSGSVPPQNELPRLESIIAHSPRFLEARVLAARALLTRFESTKEDTYRQRSLAMIQEATKLAPDDPAPLEARLKIELASDRPQVAAATLAQLESLLPGDPRIFGWRADLAEQEGHMDEALAGRRAAAERAPSWVNLFSLADLEARTGHVDEARQHLRKLLAGSPDNFWALNKLARIELLFGDLNQAEQIYQELISHTPQRAYFANLGNIRVLLGRYEDAIVAFHQALALDPGQVDVTLNLAEAELALGRTRDAREHFQAALQHLEKNRPPGGFSPEASMTQAQCLAHLGRTREAVEITLQALRQNPDDPNIKQDAALVYALAGDRASALVNIQSALQGGVKARWFNLPAFASLQNDAEFREILRQGSKSPHP
jgi:eukaryotic-like serine/threonine-protein kinase